MGCICESPNGENPLEQNRNSNKTSQINQSKQNNQTFPANEPKIKQINNKSNNYIINKEENNLETNNNTNNDINKPPIHKYEPGLLVSTNSYVSKGSSDQREILIYGEKNSQYSYKPGDLDNNEFVNYLQDKDKYAGENIPLSESFSYFNKNNQNNDLLNENKTGTFVSTSRPKLPTMQSQKIKKSQYYFNKGKGNKINISLSGSGTGSGVYIYYPNKDNTPIPDLENITEKILEQD